MILACFRRARRISALAALVCAAIAAFGARETGVAAERQIREHVVAHAELLSVARSDIVNFAPRLGPQERNTSGFLLAPPDAPVAIARDMRHRPDAPAAVETLITSRPRRLAFRYEAIAPPSAL
jgi:hypothetical protein